MVVVGTADVVEPYVEDVVVGNVDGVVVADGEGRGPWEGERQWQQHHVDELVVASSYGEGVEGIAPADEVEVGAIVGIVAIAEEEPVAADEEEQRRQQLEQNEEWSTNQK